MQGNRHRKDERGHIHTHTHIHTHKPVCERGDGELLWNHETEFTANTPDIIIKHRKEKHVQ